jgi:hypothetical protein
MPLAHELVFNVLRNRADRYEAIAQAMRYDPASHLPALEGILSCNRFSEAVTGRINRLLGLPAAGQGTE